MCVLMAYGDVGIGVCGGVGVDVDACVGMYGNVYAEMHTHILDVVCTLELIRIDLLMWMVLSVTMSMVV